MVTLLAITSVSANAQTEWVYSYDATGNRTQRTVNTGPLARKKESSTKNLLSDSKINAILDSEHNRLKIETLGSIGADIAIYDLSGRELVSTRVVDKITNIDLSSMRRGTYILTVEIDNEKKTCKFNK